MELLIAARQSDLARLQAYQVGQALESHGHKVHYHFRESLGDINQNDPLWKMPEKGVFTEDFREGLIQGQWDLVVHSWKDLPIEVLTETEIVATLPRADARDVFLCKKSRLAEKKKSLNVFSSSPRRMHNLTPVLKKFFPQPLDSIQFHSVRGNILTRVRKLIEDERMDGLVVAKAALDRLLLVQGEEFEEGKAQLLAYLESCAFQVLPLSLNPTAAAQGALAIEISRSRPELKKVLADIHCQKTWNEAHQERQVLKQHGGGCHQKIGVAVLEKDYGTLQILKGETETGAPLDEITLNDPIPKLENPCVEKNQFYKRKEKSFHRDPLVTGHFVARDHAIPEGTVFSENELIWASGVSTWEALASRGYWVSGCSDGLGEETLNKMGPLCGERTWARWTHDGAPSSSEKQVWATYSLQPVDVKQDLSQYKEFFWRSGSQFERALEICPAILGAKHYCGPGHTYTKILEVLQSKNIKNQPRALPDYRLWLQAIEEWKNS